ncbi:MAG TPA: PASTA domain-containing protein [Crocinitomicaceae bacterium]|nr:PASTA domain-containing protein [Crocinitomicaceae bacterium]
MLKKLGNFILSKKFLFNLIGIGLVYLIVIFGFKYYLSSRTNLGQKIEVPNLIGKNQNELKGLFANSDLTFQVLDSIYDPTKVEGSILEQDPKASSLTDVFVKEGRVIKVRVSKRSQLVEVPDLVDKSQRFAENILINRKFRYKLEYQPSREAHGAVIDQLYKGKHIDAKTKLPIGSRIVLIVGRDETGVVVSLPNLYGLTIVEAKQRVAGMANMEFLAVCPTCLTSADSLVARIVSQSPEFSDGAVISTGTTVSVYAEKEFNGDAPQ